MLCVSKRLVVAAAASATVLTGCYVVPLNPDGTPAYPYHYAYNTPPYAGVPVAAVAPGRVPTQLNARLYPINDAATETGVMTGSVTNLMNGKGRFQLNFQGELLSGEATRTSGDERQGVANAYGSRGTYMSCEYKMNTPYQGAGTCTLSNGAKYEVHLGS